MNYLENIGAPARSTKVPVSLAQLAIGVGEANKEMALGISSIQELRIRLNRDAEITTAIPLVDIESDFAESALGSDVVGADLGEEISV